MRAVPQADAATPAATCPSCRRSVIPERGALGAECSRCEGLLVHARLPARRKPPAPAARTSRAEVVGAVAEHLLEEHRERCATVGEFAELHAVALCAVAEAAAVDADWRERRTNARHWRRQLPELTELLGA